MKIVKLSGFALGALFSFHVLADNNVTYDYGTVVEAVPIVKTIRVSTPREECWDERVVYRNNGRNDGLNTILGAVIGGAIGNAVGNHKRNKQVGVVLGAVLGGSVAKTISRNNRGRVRAGTEEVCEVINEYEVEERVVGYRVRYRYNGETYTTRTDTDPGESIKLRLAVSPVS